MQLELRENYIFSRRTETLTTEVARYVSWKAKCKRHNNCCFHNFKIRFVNCSVEKSNKRRPLEQPAGKEGDQGMISVYRRTQLHMKSFGDRHRFGSQDHKGCRCHQSRTAIEEGAGSR